MKYRGTYKFEVNSDETIINSDRNAELLRKLWLDKEIIKPNGPGPGDPGDFDNGAWHVACHLVAAGCVKKIKDERLIWLEISHDTHKKIYKPTLTVREKNNVVTYDLHETIVESYLENSELLGFVEGTSEGRISANGVLDDENIFNGSVRQDYNQEPGNRKEGGRVWEHWCTTRDIRKTSIIGSSVIYSYLALLGQCGNNFIPIVARGRIDYEHPAHLLAMINAGLVSPTSSKINIIPSAIPNKISLLFQAGDTISNFFAAEKLIWSDKIEYYMFERRIDRWNKDF